jgi:hypothetical protein
MSGFKHHRDNQHRYNIYENYIEEIEENNFYEKLRNTLFYIALILIISITFFISFDIYQKNLDNTSKILLVNQNQQNQVKDEITQIELTQVISNSIIKKIDMDNSFNEINQYQLKLIIKNVMEKIQNSPNHIISTRE